MSEGLLHGPASSRQA